MAVDKVFKQVDKGDGTFEYVEVTAAELPEEIVKETPQYKTVLDESVKRRKIIQDLKRPVVTNDDETEIVKEVPTPKTETPAPAVDKDALYDEFRTRMLNEMNVETKAAKTAREQHEANVDAAMKAHKLSSPEIRLVVSASANPAETAALLAKSGYRFDDVQGGETQIDIKSEPVTDIIGRLKKRFQE